MEQKLIERGSLEEKSEKNNVEDSLNLLKKYNGKSGFFNGLRRKKGIKKFAREHSEEARTLVDYFKETAGPVERVTTFSEASKIEKVLNEHEISQEPNRLKRFMKRHPAVWKSAVGALVFTQGYFSARSPTHPILVDSYLMQTAFQSGFSNPQFFETKLNEFLTTNKQFDRYTQDLIEDIEDLLSEKAFVIAEKEGKLEQKNVRTINSAIHKMVPFASSFLDRKHITRLDDEIDLIKQGYKIVAKGHYHSFGGRPSSGDKLVQRVSSLPEIVVSNGFVPKVYIDGRLADFGRDVEIDQKKLDFLLFSYGAEDLLNELTRDSEKVEKEKDIKYVLKFLENKYKINSNDDYGLTKAIDDQYKTFLINFNKLFLSKNKDVNEFMCQQRFLWDLIFSNKSEIVPYKNMLNEIIENEHIDKINSLKERYNHWEKMKTNGLNISIIGIDDKKDVYDGNVNHSSVHESMNLDSFFKDNIDSSSIYIGRNNRNGGFFESRAFFEFNTSDIPITADIKHVFLELSILEGDFCSYCSVDISRFSDSKISDLSIYPDNVEGNKKLWEDLGNGINNAGFYLTGLKDFQSRGTKTFELGDLASRDLENQLSQHYFGVGLKLNIPKKKTYPVVICPSESQDEAYSPKLIVAYTLGEEDKKK